MLVLSRRIGEETVITLPTGEEVSVIVTNIVKGVVKLGITAPKHIEVNRREVLRLRATDPKFIPMRKSPDQS